MRIFPNLTYFFLLFFIIGLTKTNYGQINSKRERKIRKNKKYKKSILDNLPTFFVDDSRLPQYLKQIYKRDAARMSIRLLTNELRISKQTVEIPEELVQAIYNAMVAVRTSDYSSVDSLARKYYVRTFPVPNVEKIVLITEFDAPWIEPLKQRQDTTGSIYVNNIIQNHDLFISKLVYMGSTRDHVGLVLQSRKPINIPALMMRFFQQGGIGSMEEVLPYGDGNDITIQRTKKGWDLDYSVKFSNCHIQCQKYHNWSYTVKEDGEVLYNGSSGHTIPPWITPSIEGKQFPDVLAARK